MHLNDAKACVLVAHLLTLLLTCSDIEVLARIEGVARLGTLLPVPFTITRNVGLGLAKSGEKVDNTACNMVDFFFSVAHLAPPSWINGPAPGRQKPNFFKPSGSTPPSGQGTTFLTPLGHEALEGDGIHVLVLELYGGTLDNWGELHISEW